MSAGPGAGVAESSGRRSAWALTDEFWPGRPGAQRTLQRRGELGASGRRPGWQRARRSPGEAGTRGIRTDGPWLVPPGPALGTGNPGGSTQLPLSQIARSDLH